MSKLQCSPRLRGGWTDFPRRESFPRNTIDVLFVSRYFTHFYEVAVTVGHVFTSVRSVCFPCKGVVRRIGDVRFSTPTEYFLFIETTQNFRVFLPIHTVQMLSLFRYP